MGLRILRFIHEEEIKWGALEDEIHILNVEAKTLKEILEIGLEKIKNLAKDGVVVLESDIQILSPVTKDANIYCQGANYGLHREEAGFSQQKPAYNLMFTKASSSLTSAKSDIEYPENVRLLDYEVELGLIIKRNIVEPLDLTVEKLGKYIAGFVITNDISARDIQIVEQQWFKGKSFRGFCPVGPYIYLIEENEIDYLNQLELELKVNGEIRQKSNTSQLLFTPHETLNEMSRIFDLNVGDLILTGTPGGVCLKLNTQILEKINENQLSYEEKIEYFVSTQSTNGYLSDGDVISITIKSIDGQIDLGRQENTIRKSLKTIQSKSIYS